MHRFRASSAATRLVLALGLVFSISTPVSAGGASIDVSVGTSSPTKVTAGHYVAYPVTVINSGANTLNTVSVSLHATDALGTTTLPFGTDFAYIGAIPASCTQVGDPKCVLGQLPSTASRTVTFYFHVTGAARSVWVKAAVSTSEGTKDNSDATANNIDYWESLPIETQVVDQNDDFISGHGILEVEETLTTGLSVKLENPHGTLVTVPRNAEVTIQELKPADLPPCPASYPTCFGWGSVLDVGTDNGADEYFDAGIVVTMVWDDSQLPKGMTPKKLRVVHYPDPTSGEAWLAETVNPSCTYDRVTALPNNMPCFLTPPSKVGGKDIQAVMLWAHNGIGRGW